MPKAAYDERRESIIQELIARFGEFKKVVRMHTGVAYKVPTRAILEKGIKEQDLDRYPLWEDITLEGCVNWQGDY
jgi:hypothetical protein